MTEATELIEMILVEHQHAEEKELRAIRLSLLVLIGMLAVVAVVISFMLYLGVHDQTDRQAEHDDLLAAVCSFPSDIHPIECEHLGEP